jgi:hypothetical protein
MIEEISACSRLKRGRLAVQSSCCIPLPSGRNARPRRATLYFSPAAPRWRAILLRIVVNGNDDHLHVEPNSWPDRYYGKVLRQESGQWMSAKPSLYSLRLLDSSCSAFSCSTWSACHSGGRPRPPNLWRVTRLERRKPSSSACPSSVSLIGVASGMLGSREAVAAMPRPTCALPHPRSQWPQRSHGQNPSDDLKRHAMPARPLKKLVILASFCQTCPLIQL